jgi:hypothetical protein
MRDVAPPSPDAPPVTMNALFLMSMASPLRQIEEF